MAKVIRFSEIGGPEDQMAWYPLPDIMAQLSAMVAVGVIILGVMTSGFTFLRIDAYYQEIVKGVIIVAAVVADQYRQRNRRSA